MASPAANEAGDTLAEEDIAAEAQSMHEAYRDYQLYSECSGAERQGQWPEIQAQAHARSSASPPISSGRWHQLESMHA
jgi:hypothetical protein